MLFNHSFHSQRFLPTKNSNNFGSSMKKYFIYVCTSSYVLHLAIHIFIHFHFFFYHSIHCINCFRFFFFFELRCLFSGLFIFGWSFSFRFSFACWSPKMIFPSLSLSFRLRFLFVGCTLYYIYLYCVLWCLYHLWGHLNV